MIVFDRGLAEDAVQTAFIKAAERIHQFDAKRPFAPWFFRIVVNDALKFVKRQKRNISLENLDEPATQIAEWLAASGFLGTAARQPPLPLATAWQETARSPRHY